jgi:hypothetical protein
MKKKCSYFDRLQEFELTMIQDALDDAFNVTQAAESLGIRRTTLVEKMKKFKIKITRQKDRPRTISGYTVGCLMLVLLQACSTVPVSELPQEKPVVTLPQHSQPTIESEYKVKFIPVEYYTTPEQRTKITRSGVKVKETMQSECAKDFILKRKLIDTNGKTQQQVYDHLMSLSGDVPVKMYYRRFTSAVAYRQPPSKEINLNTKYFTTDLSDCEWAATMAHEGLGHSLGEYDHDFEYSPSRSYSVPYTLGGGDSALGGDVFTKCCH